MYKNGASAREIGLAIGDAIGGLISAEDVRVVAKAAGITNVGDVLRGFMAGKAPDPEPVTESADPSTGADNKAMAIITEFEEQMEKAGTFGPDGVERAVVVAYAHITKTSPKAGPPILNLLETRAIKAGVDPRQVGSLIRAIERCVQGRAIRLTPASEIMARPDPAFLVEGLIEEGCFACLYSMPEVGKTHVALDWCFSVSAGLPWFGRSVIQGAVVYVVAEGAGGIPKRMRALCEHHGHDDPPQDFHFIEQPVNLLDPGSVAEAMAAVEEMNVRPRLVVFDTYARCMLDGDENSAKDTGRAVDALDRLRFRLNAAVLVVHHTDKSGFTERGSGALRGAADIMLKMTECGDGIRRLEIDKMKNFDAGPPFTLQLTPVGDSVVPVEVDTSGTTWAKVAGAPDPKRTKRLRFVSEIVAALKDAHDAGLTPLTQTALLESVSGSAAPKAAVLHDLADDPDSPVVMEMDGKRKLYSWCG